ncbi:hypothetical protein V2J09_010342 [Rumex salicifolius]
MRSIFLSFVLLCIVSSIEVVKGQLQTDYYSSSCPNVEKIVRSTVESHFDQDDTIAPALLRLHFHDCFVQGCDASVLIKGSSSERTAIPNLSLRGFDVIDDAKSQVESVCPGVVSCADIVALAARDAVDLSDGPSWSVPLGRLDGRVSSSSDTSSLPSPLESIAVHRQKFAAKGLNDHDLVTLVGAHTIGQTACRNFQYRLYNFTATGNSDPTVSPSTLAQLQSQCPKSGDGSNRVGLDEDTPAKFDVSFFKNIKDGSAVLESDQRLWADSVTGPIVQKYAGSLRGLLGLRFNFDFPKAMVKMSGIGVKSGSHGEIRRVCSKIN